MSRQARRYPFNRNISAFGIAESIFSALIHLPETLFAYIRSKIEKDNFSFADLLGLGVFFNNDVMKQGMLFR